MWLGLCGLKEAAQRAGLNVRETKQEMTVDAAIVTANCRKNSPDIPDRKADGTNTAQSVERDRYQRSATSSIVLWAAAIG